MVSLLSFLQEVCGDGAQDSLHHSKVLFTIMGLKEKNNTTHLVNRHGKCHSINHFSLLFTATYLKESRSKVVLNEYTAYTPDITGMVPAQI